MELLHPASFASSVASAKDSLKRISVIISRYCGEETANEFLIACDNLDSATSNKILDKTVEILTGYSSVPIALSAFADKFPQLNPQLSDDISSVISEMEKVKAIDSYWKEITEIME